MKNFGVLFIFTVFLSVPFTYRASQAEENQLEKVLITATKNPVPQDQLGASTRIITREEIERSGKKDLGAVLSAVTSFQVARTGSRGSLTSLFVRGANSNFNLVMINGIQVNNSGGLFDFGQISTENIERIEIVKGAHSSLYGSDAAASVINIITKKAQDKLTIDSSAAFGGRAEGGVIQEYFSSLSGGDGNYGFFFSYGRIDDEGILEINNDYTNNSFTANLNADFSENISLGVFSVYRDAEFGFPTGGAGDRFDVYQDPDSGTEGELFVIGSDLAFSFTDEWRNSVRFGYSKNDNKNYDGPGPAGSEETETITETDDKRISVEYMSSLEFDLESISGVASAGFEYEKENFKSPGDIDESRTNYAFFTQKHLGVFDRVFVTAGMRIDDNERFGRHWSPSAFASFELLEGTRIRAGIGKGLREPSFSQNYSRAFTTPNPDLHPEESLNIEAGIDQSFHRGMGEVKITFFQNKFKNLIAYSFEGFANGTSYDNVNKSEAKGIEVEFSLSPTDILTFSGGYTYLDSEVADDGGLGSESFAEGRKLLRRPDHSFYAGGNCNINGFNINASGKYVGKRDDMNWSESARVENDSYFTMDIATSYEFPISQLAQNVKIFARAENLFNNDYEDVFGFSSPGLSVTGGISLRM